MFLYSNGLYTKLDPSCTPPYDHFIDIRASYERLFYFQPTWVHFPYRMIVESTPLPEFIEHGHKLFIFNGCPYGIMTSRAVDLLFNMGYKNCFTLTVQKT